MQCIAYLEVDTCDWQSELIQKIAILRVQTRDCQSQLATASQAGSKCYHQPGPPGPAQTCSVQVLLPATVPHCHTATAATCLSANSLSLANSQLASDLQDCLETLCQHERSSCGPCGSPVIAAVSEYCSHHATSFSVAKQTVHRIKSQCKYSSVLLCTVKGLATLVLFAMAVSWRLSTGEVW